MCNIPKYNQELNYFKGIKSCFIIEGNIDDIYPIYDNENKIIKKFASLLNLLSGIFDFELEKGKTNLLYCDANIGFGNPLYSNTASLIIKKYEKLTEDEKDIIRNINGKPKKEHHSSHKVILNSEIIRKALTEPINAEENENPVTVVLDNASRLCVNSESLNVDESVIFSNIQYAIQNAYIGNTLILICEKADDLPDWLRKNSNIKKITIPPPSRDIREAFIKTHISLKEDDDEKSFDKLIDFSDKLQLSELSQINMLYQNSECTLNDAMMIYRFGVKEKLWLQMKERINNMNIEQELSKRIKGQKHAISAVANAVRKVSNGMNNLSSNSSNAQPPIRALFAGPTGVGKTEMIKALSEIVYADERAIVRFDCGEYSTEGSEGKLIGSPPGYVGYGNSGELITALKQNPNCILLFDEIEKAHDRVFTLLLGLLDDGRVTSGDGETIYASDAMIFFTSNVGIAKIIKEPTGEKKKIVNVGPSASHEELEEIIIKEINNYFKPEFIGRLSDIIAFDYLGESVAIEIMKLKVENIVRNLYEQNKLTLIVNDSVIDYLTSCCKQEENRMYGGRSIKNLVEKTLENSVCSFVVSHPNVNKIIANIGNDEIICKEG